MPALVWGELPYAAGLQRGVEQPLAVSLSCQPSSLVVTNQSGAALVVSLLDIFQYFGVHWDYPVFAGIGLYAAGDKLLIQKNEKLQKILYK